jgi:hypothetical protein
MKTLLLSYATAKDPLLAHIPPPSITSASIVGQKEHGKEQIPAVYLVVEH